MSRLVGVGFILFDATATIASVLSASGAMLFVVLSVLSSIALALMSMTVRSVFWPSYFWNESS